jgi:SAM-dependent methyltransferase
MADGATSDLEETYWWYRARKEIICDTVRRFLSPGSQIIDFGAGSGVIAKQLVDLGYEVVATDISPSALAACRARGLNTLDLNTHWPTANSADCILACDVLEHLDDDVGLLQKLRPALRSRGFLIVAVPAYDFLWSGEDYISNHVRRYTKSLLEKRVRAAGFTIERCSYFNMLLLPVIAAVVFYKRLLRPRDMYASDVRPLPKWQNTILYKIFAAERNILPRIRFPAGASILLVGRVSS